MRSVLFVVLTGFAAALLPAPAIVHDELLGREMQGLAADYGES